MRVIGGEFRSRRLESMPGADVRPTSDRLRETLFNILSPAIAGAVFVDAYAGTGAVGIEALSRGARHAIFIEKRREAVNLIRANLATLKIESRARVIHGSASLYLDKLDADIVFLDPPYPKEREYQAALEALETKPPELVIVQHSARFALPEQQGPLQRTRIVKQGDNALSFFRRSL
ncbi:MAG TPA: 16S rRNA (guanine(966)-N(2))-methyltransferase RsmD [Bryobacteraceae bacterium]|nr:16S rRNA (guanine(966)-N(2))-methyltransferase RsmD [Bryobacteraceae bacterium]